MVPPNGLFITDNTINMDDLVVPLFQDTSILYNLINPYVSIWSIPIIRHC